MPNMTDKIFELTAPYNNPFQGRDRRVLFVCSAGILRSATAANMYAKKGLNTRSAGTAPYALIPLSANLIEWADQIVFVNQENYDEARITFSGDDRLHKSITGKAQVLNIPDDYEYNHPDLINHFETQYA